METQTFDIRNHLDKLTPSGKKNKYFCPNCEGNDLSIELETGKYNCFNGCKCSDVREAIAPWAERQSAINSATFRKTIPSPKGKKRKPAPIPPGAKLLLLPGSVKDIPKPQSLTGKPPSGVPCNATVTKHLYTDDQWVIRCQWDDPSKDKGYSKTFRPIHIDEDWNEKIGKGDEIWPAYKEQEVLGLLKSCNGVSVAIFWQEGEKVVEIGRSAGIPSLTLQGSAWSQEDIKRTLTEIKRTHSNTVQLFLADPDSTGRKKAKNFREACSELGMPCLIVYPNDICDGLKGDKNDLEQILQHITPQEFIGRLQAMLDGAVELSEDDKLKLELLCLLQESDPIKKARKRAEICSNHRLSKPEVEELQRAIQRQTQTKETKVYNLEELFALESEGLQWVIPELLPKGETIILAGSPKAGKTLLAIDAAFCIATGEEQFLGQSLKKGKVLFVSCDESLQSTKSKLVKRGFRVQDKDFIRVLPEWTIDNLPLLEAQLEDFRPDVVIIDSLKRITHGSLVSENSAEFADNIYTLKELLAKYRASGILIHHTAKNPELMGVGKIRGSSAIAGSVWGTWQLEHIPTPDPNNPKKLIIDPRDPKRVLDVFSRDCEGQKMPCQFDPENNSYTRLDTEEQSESGTIREQILRILDINPKGLSGVQILECMGLDKESGRSVYTELNRMVSKLIISCHPHSESKRTNIYSLVISSKGSNFEGDSPPPPPYVADDDYDAENFTQQGLENTAQNTAQTLLKHSSTFSKNTPDDFSNPYTAKDTGIVINSQQKGGERGGSQHTPLSTEKPITIHTGEILTREEYDARQALGDLETPSWQGKSSQSSLSTTANQQELNLPSPSPSPTETNLPPIGSWVRLCDDKDESIAYQVVEYDSIPGRVKLDGAKMSSYHHSSLKVLRGYNPELGF